MAQMSHLAATQCARTSVWRNDFLNRRRHMMPYGSGNVRETLQRTNSQSIPTTPANDLGRVPCHDRLSLDARHHDRPCADNGRISDFDPRADERSRRDPALLSNSYRRADKCKRDVPMIVCSRAKVGLL